MTQNDVANSKASLTTSTSPDSNGGSVNADSRAGDYTWVELSEALSSPSRKHVLDNSTTFHTTVASNKHCHRDTVNGRFTKKTRGSELDDLETNRRIEQLESTVRTFCQAPAVTLELTRLRNEANCPNPGIVRVDDIPICVARFAYSRPMVIDACI